MRIYRLPDKTALKDLGQTPGFMPARQLNVLLHDCMKLINHFRTIASGFKETKAKHELLAVFIIIIIIIEADVLMQCKNKHVPNSGPDWFRPC